MVKYDKESITSFLTFRYDLNRLTEFNYPYDIDIDIFNSVSHSFEKSKRLVRETLIKSIEKDKTKHPAVMMSGGVDSVFVAALLKQIHPNLKCYTARFKGDNESKLATDAASALNIDHTIVDVYPEDYIDIDRYLKPLIKLKGEPLHPNEIALAKTERVAKLDGCDKVFCGEGADDIFGGYSNIFMYYRKHKINEFLDYYRYFSLEERTRIINKDYLMDDNILMKRYLKDVPQHIFGPHFIQTIHTPGLIKRGINAIKFNDMDWSFPYVDKKLVTLVNSLPLEYKNFGDISKYILREISLEYIPRKFSYSVKHPFPVPFNDWMKDINKWNLNDDVFLSNDISSFDGWHKWMLINLNIWLENER